MKNNLQSGKYILPEFLIIGAAKSGTSTLFKYLIKHQNIFIPLKKELEFFCNDKNYSKGMSWYVNQFIEAQKTQLIGEASTTYTRWPHTSDSPKRIYENIPKVKMIYIMRHPVERAFSHYLHHMREGITMTFEQAIVKSNLYVDCSKYMMQIERYLRFFPKEAFLFLTMDDLKYNPAKLLKNIQKFLEAPNISLINENKIVANKSSADHFIRKYTTDKMLQLPGMVWIKNKIPDKIKISGFDLIKKSIIGKYLNAQYKIPPMQIETRHNLLNIFKNDTYKLEKFLNRNLKSWYE